MENRKYTRLNLDVMAEIHLQDGACLYGETGDLSLDGAYVTLNPPQAVQMGEQCRLRLILRSDEHWVKTEFRSTVTHIQETGIGLQFNQASINHHSAYLRLLLDGADDVDAMLEELSRNAGGEFRFTG